MMTNLPISTLLIDALLRGAVFLMLSVPLVGLSLRLAERRLRLPAKTYRHAWSEILCAVFVSMFIPWSLPRA